jgi:hypothetical protein
MTELLGTRFIGLERTTRPPVRNNRVFNNRAMNSCACTRWPRGAGYGVSMHHGGERVTEASPRTR